jgi:hypothetical protein
MLARTALGDLVGSEAVLAAQDGLAFRTDQLEVVDFAQFTQRTDELFRLELLLENEEDVGDVVPD